MSSVFSLIYLAASGASLGTAQAGRAEGPVSVAAGFAVVELFTSEGCSSCPPADELLTQIDRTARDAGQPVYALSFHVDYWNRLGWDDPYSSVAATQRQRAYAAAAGERSVYTPQMVVNGGQGFVGSDRGKASRAVEEALAAPAASTLEIEASREGVAYEVAYRSMGAPRGAILNLALVEETGQQLVPRGENAGRRLQHSNIVRAFTTTRAEASGVTSVTLPGGIEGPLRIVAYTQDRATRRIAAVASAPAP